MKKQIYSFRILSWINENNFKRSFCFDLYYIRRLEININSIKSVIFMNRKQIFNLDIKSNDIFYKYCTPFLKDFLT